jgi:1-acyl-sn-glycerol-3-phosphate acyltransferase
MKRETMLKLFQSVLVKLAKVEFLGTENIPAKGGLIIATNHLSRMDSLYLFINPVRSDITALVADKYQKYPFFKWILDTGGVIWLDREKADFTAFRKAAEALNNGLAMGIALEGTRSQTGQLQAGKPGAILLAVKTGVPIIPVGISGTEAYFKKLLAFQRPKLTLNFGKPFQLPPIDRENRDESLRQMTDDVMCRIAALLPPQYWGYYKDHPRLKQLLNQS